jgi:chaperonin GroEL
MSQLPNAQFEFLLDLSAFTGARIFDMSYAPNLGGFGDLGNNVKKIEIYRYRSTLVAEPDPINIETRASELKQKIKQSESKIEKILLEERLGKITSGIAQLKIYGSSVGELKEAADRAEDAVCSVRAAINHGYLPGGCRAIINVASRLCEMIEKKEIEDTNVIENIIVPSLLAPFFKLLENAGYNEVESHEIFNKLLTDPDLVYDIEKANYGKASELGIFDAQPAVKQAILNAVSIASVMGTLGGIVCTPRDEQLERRFALDEADFNRTIDNAHLITNEANTRG